MIHTAFIFPYGNRLKTSLLLSIAVRMRHAAHSRSAQRYPDALGQQNHVRRNVDSPTRRLRVRPSHSVGPVIENGPIPGRPIRPVARCTLMMALALSHRWKID